MANQADNLQPLDNPISDFESVAEPSPKPNHRPESTGISYAVAIYPYISEEKDELDVVVGDAFIVLSRAQGWWVVQQDPAGDGLIEPDTTKQGWVPSGGLLEISVPLATAIAEASATSSEVSSPLPHSLPLSILSASVPGIALLDYEKRGEEEVGLAKDDSLRVFKQYNNWSYVVKEGSGDRGWVPSQHVGKAPTASEAL